MCRGQLSFALEISEPLPDEVNQARTEVEKFPLKIPEVARNCKIAMLRNPNMSEKDIRNRLIFIDIECAHGLENKPLPISIAALDYDGHILLDQLICPRAYVTSYNDFIHGLKEKDLLGQQDSIDAGIKIRNVLRGKIIVGHDLHMELVALNVNLNEIAGIRDLQGSKAISHCMNDGKNSWNLSEVAIRLGLKPQSKKHTAMEDARLTRQIYQAVESQWMDNSKEEIVALHSRDYNPKSTSSISRLTFLTDIELSKHQKKREERTRRVMAPDEIDLTSPDILIEEEETFQTPPSSPKKLIEKESLGLMESNEKEAQK